MSYEEGMFKIWIKKGYHIDLIPEENQLIITLDRASVAMGDDIGSHKTEITIDSTITLEGFIKLIMDWLDNIPAIPWKLKLKDVDLALLHLVKNESKLLHKDVPIDELVSIYGSKEFYLETNW